MATRGKGNQTDPGAGNPGPIAELNTDNQSTRHLLQQVGGLERQVEALCATIDKMEANFDRRMDRFEDASNKRFDKIEVLLADQVGKLDGSVRTIQQKAHETANTLKVGAAIFVLAGSIIWLLFQSNVKDMVEEAVAKVSAAKPVSVTLTLPDGMQQPAAPPAPTK